MAVASKDGQLAIVATLLAAGADMSIRTKNDWTPLRWAVRRRRLPVIRYLLDRSPSAEHTERDRAELVATARTTGAALWLEDSMPPCIALMPLWCRY